ncbi:YaaA family protein [Brachybacterium sp. UNK5269]|uniref:YaaA family protein n=1 Tax=Brachybacterium sp. UNK5269 TaxID=3408576 RepID=UPI003BAF2DA0
MLILLPPSETKTRPSEIGCPPLDLEVMTLPALRSDRATMLRAAQRTAATADAAAHLKVPASAPELVGRMLHLDQEPAAPALGVYSGVLFDQLDPASSPAPERRVLVQSALFGLVDAVQDRIPAYRLSAGSTVSRLGRAGSWWAPRLRPLAAALRETEAERGSPVVIDCRSGSYRSMMAMRSDGAVRVLEVSPVQERGGVRTVISHDAKRYRGLVTRALLAAADTPASADEVVDVVRDGLGAGLQIELEGDRLVVVDRAD